MNIKKLNTELTKLMEEYNEDNELGLYIINTRRMYDKYCQPAMDKIRAGKGEEVDWKKIAIEGARMYAREIEPLHLDGEGYKETAEYLKDYYTNLAGNFINESFTKTYELPSMFGKFALNDLILYAGLSKEQYDAKLPEIIDYSKRPYKDKYDSAVGVSTEFNPEVDDKPSFSLRFGGWINQNPDDKGEIKLINVDSSIVKRVLEFIHRYKNTLNGVDLDYVKEQIKSKQLGENFKSNKSLKESWSETELAQIGAVEDTGKKYKIYQNKGGEILVTDKKLNDNFALMGDYDTFDDAFYEIEDNWEEYATYIVYDASLLDDLKNWVQFEDATIDSPFIIDLSSDYANITESKKFKGDIRESNLPDEKEEELELIKYYKDRLTEFLNDYYFDNAELQDKYDENFLKANAREIYNAWSATMFDYDYDEWEAAELAADKVFIRSNKPKLESCLKKDKKKSLKEDFNDIKSQVDEAIDEWIKKNNWGKDYIEIYADYRDELGEDSIKAILENPEEAYEIIDSLYFDNGYFGDEEYDYAFKELKLDDEIKEEYEYEIKDYFRERVGICADYNHFLSNVRVDILIGEQVPDTYTFEDDKLVDVSDAVKFFIAKQGYTVQQFLDYYNSLPDFQSGTGKVEYDSKTFLGSLVSEVDNAYRDYWYQPVIMGNLDLEEYVKNPNIIKLEIPKNAYCGLTDRTNGTCSTLAINLEKPFIIDKNTDNFEINYYHGYKYNVDDICGLVGKCWDDAEIKPINQTNESKKSLKESEKMVMDVLNFKMGDADVKVNNLTGTDFTAEEIKEVIKEENPRIYFNNWDSYYYIMDFSFQKNGEKFWMESKYISGDYSTFEFNIYQ